MSRKPPAVERADAATIRKLRGALTRWYRRAKRDLPWRRTRDPYAIWVSEVMLQQTQVATVLPYYERFLERFPNAAALARAEEEEVLALWSGLGYYRRARSLHRGARNVMEDHAGKIPTDARTLRELPGIGRYTAGAIASIAFDHPEPILDGNVKRVLSRLHAIGGGPESRLWALAESLAAGPNPGDVNQALMELGALICTPRKPHCPLCPVRSSCRAFEMRDPEGYPAARAGVPTERVRVAVAWILRKGNVLLEKPTVGSPFRGTWDLPAAELRADEIVAGALRDRMAAIHSLDVRVGTRRARMAHGIMNRRLGLEVYECRLTRGRVARNDRLRWVEPSRLTDVATSGATRKIHRALRPVADELASAAAEKG